MFYLTWFYKDELVLTRVHKPAKVDYSVLQIAVHDFF